MNRYIFKLTNDFFFSSFLCVMKLDEWWRLHGLSAPYFQKLAILIFSQTLSSSGCERNWNVFELIHTKKRNKLEHQRLNDLVYIHYNLQLKNRYIYFLSYFEYQFYLDS